MMGGAEECYSVWIVFASILKVRAEMLIVNNYCSTNYTPKVTTLADLALNLSWNISTQSIFIWLSHWYAEFGVLLRDYASPQSLNGRR